MHFRSTIQPILLVVGGILVTAEIVWSLDPSSNQRDTDTAIELSTEHLAAANRPRRVIVNNDTNFGAPSVANAFAGMDVEQLVHIYFDLFDQPDVKVDSIWWCWLDGNYANYPSKILPIWELPGLKKWWEAGIDPLRIFAEETRKRGMEAFFSYRLNGSDRKALGPLSKPLLKNEKPEWLIHTWEPHSNPGYWNFAIEGVRQYKLAILREIAENYDYDGIEIDFARVPVLFPTGHQWENRDHLTEFMRSVRLMTLEVERKRGRPFLLAARVPENLLACHFDGMDVERWARERLVDIFVLGNRSFDVDVAGFRRIAKDTGIKLYPCVDDHHATDGYKHPPIEVFRGVFANWLDQGADGIQTFNFSNWMPEGIRLVDPQFSWKTGWQLHHQVYRDLTDLPGMLQKDKTFVVQRRGGGHGAVVIPNPENWSTPRWMSYLTNMYSPLPATLANDGKADTLLTVYVADDLDATADRISQITIHVLLSDPAAGGLPKSERLAQVTISNSPAHYEGPLRNVPPGKDIASQIELRLNNILLDSPSVVDGWLVFQPKAGQFARGDNLLGLRVTDRPANAITAVAVEKLEIHVRYR